MTKPSRVASNGRDAVSGDSLRSDSAFMLAKPPIAIGVTVASEPPVIIDVGVAVLDRAKGVADRVGARGAGRDRRVVRSLRVEAHGDTSPAAMSEMNIGMKNALILLWPRSR